MLHLLGILELGDDGSHFFNSRRLSQKKNDVGLLSAFERQRYLLGGTGVRAGRRAVVEALALQGRRAGAGSVAAEKGGAVAGPRGSFGARCGEGPVAAGRAIPVLAGQQRTRLFVT